MVHNSTSVKLLEAIRPLNAGTGEVVLLYADLEPLIRDYAAETRARATRRSESLQDSSEESWHAKRLVTEQLLRASQRMQQPDVADRDMWADLFTQSSIDLFGKPDSQEIVQLVADEYAWLRQLIGKRGIDQEQLNFLLRVYKPITVLAENKPQLVANGKLEAQSKAIAAYGHAVQERYRTLLGLADATGDCTFTTSAALHEVFTTALAWLTQNDDLSWATWKVKSTKGRSVYVSAVDRQINIPNQGGLLTAEEVHRLIAHELLVHALRAKNGYRTDNKKLAIGLDDYLEAEEGLAVLTEQAVCGRLPDKVYDRYVDVGLALGSPDGVQRSRPQMFRISYARQLLRLQAAHGHFDEQSKTALSTKVWTHIDRIYRGGPGDGSDHRQAIFTKDISYYVGYKRMAAYVTGQLAQGIRPAIIFAYLSQAKFDPTNSVHKAVLKQTATT